MFIWIGVGFAIYYLAQALVFDAKRLTLLHLTSLATLLLAKYLAWRLPTTRWGTFAFLVGAHNFILFSSIVDGLTRAHGLWSVAVLPMTTAFLWNERATVIASVVSIADVLLVAWIDQKVDIARELPPLPGIVFVMLLCTVFVFGLFSFLSTSRSHARIKTLESETLLIQQANEESVHAFEEKKVFLAKMSHEIRTPMNGLLGCIQALAQAKNATMRELSAEVQHGAQNLLVALDLCLDTSPSVELSQAANHIQSQSVRLDRCLSKAAMEISRLPGWGTLKARNDVDPALNLCELDEGRLHQLLLNIAATMPQSYLSSAPVIRMGVVRDAGVGRPWIQIQLGAAQCSVEQSDTLASRSDAQDLLRTSLDSDTHSLARAVSLHLIQEMGAVPLVAQDAAEQMVGVKIPFVEVVLPMAQSRRTPKPAVLGPKVLVVDDNAINLKVASLLLKKFGCAVELASDGVQAVTKADERAYDLILMDMRMPNMDGLEATRKIKAVSRSNRLTPIVALTANAYESDRRACLDAGMVEHLAKPLSPKALTLVLSRYVESMKDHRELRCA